jgi:protein-S-isoprenylcysteine O-methyltransferase Ste14
MSAPPLRALAALLLRIKPPRFAQGLLVGSLLLHLLVRGPHRGNFASIPGGALVAAAGTAVMVWAWALFRRHDTPIRPTDRALVLVTGGPFAFSRNPMYLGVTAALLGVAIAVGSGPVFLAPFGFAALMSAVFIPFEEARLEQSFGDAYRRYRARTYRWLGRTAEGSLPRRGRALERPHAESR